MLDVKPAMLSFNLYIKPKAQRYETFEIPKKSGGTRIITAPVGDLKLIQKRLSELLQNCLQEIELAQGFSDEGIKRERVVHGFKRARTIMTNAKEYLRRRYVFNADLSDFFDTINFGRVRGFFIKNHHFALQPKVATVLAQIACYDGKLPQGSPCSPVISNLVAHILDVHLLQLASRAGCIYTRYADDLTFSTNKKSFPAKIAKIVADQPHSWSAGSELKKIVQKNGFALNESKTRMQYNNSRQDVTGLVVNQKVNVSRTYRHAVRAMVHSLRRTGEFHLPHSVKKVSNAQEIMTIEGESDQLHGMLSYIHQVESYNRKVYNNINPPYPDYPGRERLYRSFLFFDLLFNAKIPVVVCEGKTDNVYLTQAIHALVGSFPKLATKNADGDTKFNIRILKYFDNRTGSILRLHGGSGSLRNLISDYISHATLKFTAPVSPHPVILLLDNDDGAKEVYGAATKISGNPINGEEKFIHVSSNFYIVPTPKKADGSDSKIEDFFDAKTLTTSIDGKTLDQSKDKDTSKHFGKVVFAFKIVQKGAAKIKFDGFKPILSNIVAAIKDYEKKAASVAPTKTASKT